MISWFWFERKRSKKMGGEGGKSKYKNYEGAIYHFGGRDTRSKSTLACHPVSSPRDFHNRDIFLGPVPLPSPFLLVNDGKLMYGSWLEWLYTHEGNSPPLLPPPGGGGLEAAATSRGKNSVQPRLPENCTRRVTEFCPRLLANWFLCWLCSTRGTHEPFSPPPLHPPPTPLVFAPIPARGPSLSNEIRDEIFFSFFLFLSLSLWLRFEILSFFCESSNLFLFLLKYFF